MYYGLYASAAGLLTSMHRADVAGNNLANINTVGFKPQLSAVMQRDPARLEKGDWNQPSNALLERLGGGTLIAPSATVFRQGSIQETGNPLDVAIEGDGFFVVSGDGGASAERIRFTRDGRFSIDHLGRLVTATDGRPVLDTRDQVIRLNPNQPIEITADGAIEQNRVPIARLQVTSFPTTDRLVREGDGLFRADANSIENRRPAAKTRIAQRYIETSAVEPVQALMDVTEATGAVARNANIISLHDSMLNRLINSYARVS